MFYPEPGRILKSMQRILMLFAVIIAIGTTAGYVGLKQATKTTATGTIANNSQNPKSTPAPSAEPTAIAPKYDIDSPDSVTVVVNKQRPLPLDYRAVDLYAPPVKLRQSASTENMQVRQVMEADLVAMFEAANEAGLQLAIGSAYRSAATQKTLYNGYVASSGQVYADLTSARPGFSEHQTGLSIDFVRFDGSCFIEKCFADTAEGTWLANNAHRFGFVLRYPLNKTDITGYDFEPWHFRYLGVEPATAIYEQNITVEEFFELGPAPDY